MLIESGVSSNSAFRKLGSRRGPSSRREFLVSSNSAFRKLGRNGWTFDFENVQKFPVIQLLESLEADQYRSLKKTTSKMVSSNSAFRKLGSAQKTHFFLQRRRWFPVIQLLESLEVELILVK